jgi:hypothetical protein
LVAALFLNLRIELSEPLRHDQFQPLASPFTALAFTLPPLTRIKHESEEQERDEGKADNLQGRAHSGQLQPND